MGDIYSPPIRLIAPGWVPEGWVEDKENKIFTPPGVRYFTPGEALEVAAICPACFPKAPITEMTAYFALAGLAATNRMACIRVVSEKAEGPIVAVGMLGVRDSLRRGRVSFFNIVVLNHLRFTKEGSEFYRELYSFLVNLAREETYPVVSSRAPEHEI